MRYLTNPYMVTAGGTEVEYEQLTGTTNTVQSTTVDFGQGLAINASDSQLIGAKPTKFSVYGKKYGSPSGDSYCVICKYTDSPPLSNVLATSNVINANTWTTSNEWLEYDFDGSYALVQYDSINFIYMSGDPTNYIITKQLSTGQVFETGKCFWNLGTSSIWLGSATAYPNMWGANQDARLKLTVIE